MTDLFSRIKQDVAIVPWVERDTGSRAAKSGTTRRINPCPFCAHNDSFTLYPHDNTWRCFSPGCDKGKNQSLIDYVMLRRGLHEPLEAAKEIAVREGIRDERGSRSAEVGTRKSERGARKPTCGGQTAQAVCRLAATCPKAPTCGHGKPHTPDSHCEHGDLCYDHNPPERAWCEIYQRGSGDPPPPGDEPPAGQKQNNKDPNIPLIPPKRAFQVRRMAADFYHGELLNNPVALAYQQITRGHSIEVLVACKVGYASERSLIKQAAKDGFSVEDLEAVGLAERGKHGYRPWIPKGAYVYPHMSGGRVGFFTMKRGKDETPFQVRKQFAAKGWLCMHQEALRAKRFMLVEGENDLLTVLDKGKFPQVSAIIGNFNPTNIVEHLSAQKLEGATAYLCFDNDEAGRKYTQRFTEAVRQAGGQVRVVTLPEGVKDIDDYLRQVQAPEAVLKDLLAAAHDPPKEAQPSDPSLIPPGDAPPPPSSDWFSFKNFSVLGEMEDGRLVFQANDIQKIHICSLRDLTMEKMVQIGGVEVKKRVARSDKELEEGQVHLYALRKHMVLQARSRQLGSLHWIGQGIHAISGDQLLIVNGSEAYLWNGSTLSGYPEAMIENRIISRRSSARWIDADQLSERLTTMTPELARAAIADLIKLISQWGFEGAYDVHLVTGFILAQIIQSVWIWRPQLWITGKHGSGKTILLDLIREIGGDLARHFEGAITTEPGFRQGLRNDFLLAAIDEFEKTDDRDKIISYLRTAGRGGFSTKGSPDQQVVEYYIKHMVLLASIEVGLARAAEKTRFLVAELKKDEKRNPQKPMVREIDELRIRLFALAIWQALPCRRLIASMPRIKGYDPRLAEAYAVPFAMISIHEPDPTEHLLTSVGLAMDDHERRQDETPEDEETILDAILNSTVRVAVESDDDRTVYAERSILWLLKSQSPLHTEDAASCGVWALKDDNSIFFATDLIRRKLLKDTPWSTHNITGILKRIPGMQKQRVKRSRKLYKGLSLAAPDLLSREIFSDDD